MNGSILSVEMMLIVLMTGHESSTLHLKVQLHTSFRERPEQSEAPATAFFHGLLHKDYSESLMCSGPLFLQ